MPCCCPPTASAATSSSPPAAAAACWKASHHADGFTLVLFGCAAEPLRCRAPVCASRITILHDWVDESTPATRCRAGIAAPIVTGGSR
jgi:hypothetical protein